MIDGKPLFYKCWFENNITHVEEIVKQKTFLQTSNDKNKKVQTQFPPKLYTLLC